MAARENQGLQIALILFVMLVVVLSVTTYIFWKKAFEQEESAKSEIAKRTDVERQLTDQRAENGKLKEMIGWTADEKLATVEASYKSDMRVFSDDEKKNYRAVASTLLKGIWKLDEKAIKHVELAAKTEVEKTDVIKLSSKDVETAKKGLEDAVAQQKQVTQTFSEETQRTVGEKEALAKQLDQTRKESEKVSDKAKGDVSNLTQQLARSEQMRVALVEKAKGVSTENFEVFDGRVAWVNQSSRLVYIHLGSADNLQRQLTFSVFDAEVTNVNTSKPKAKIEVVQISGEHLAEARILEDDIKNPVMPEDKLYSPAWHPGLQVHFAIAGFIDIDGDNVSDRDLVRNVIRMNGGIVDAELGDEGKRTGALTVNTRFLVMGDRPTDSASQDAIRGYTTMVGESAKLGIEQIAPQKLLSSMGWKGGAKAVTLGKGARAEDFRPKAAGGVSPTAPGNTAFRDRRPPGDKAP